jgi:hypothetical protein
MERNGLRGLADRLGFMAYLFVLGGGRADIAAMVDEATRQRRPASTPRLRQGTPASPFANTVPLDIRRPHEELTNH